MPAERAQLLELAEVRRLGSEIAAFGMRVHQSAERRTGMRGGMGDSAALLDAIVAQLRKTRKSKARDQLIAMVELCADEIMVMRERVTVPCLPVRRALAAQHPEEGSSDA